MLRSFLFASALVSFAPAVAAQCSLSVTGTGAPGTSLTIAVDGSSTPGFVFVAIGDTQGTTSIPLGVLGTLDLGLAVPFVPVQLGPADANGDASLTIQVPAQIQGGLDFFAQGITLGFTVPTGPLGGGFPNLFTLCTTNVVGFHVGS